MRGAATVRHLSTADLCFQGAEQVTHFCRQLNGRTDADVTPPVTSAALSDDAANRPLSESQRIRKVIVELIETERQYVKVSDS